MFIMRAIELLNLDRVGVPQVNGKIVESDGTIYCGGDYVDKIKAVNKSKDLWIEFFLPLRLEGRTWRWRNQTRRSK